MLSEGCVRIKITPSLVPHIGHLNCFIPVPFVTESTDSVAPLLAAVTMSEGKEMAAVVRRSNSCGLNRTWSSTQSKTSSKQVAR